MEPAAPRNVVATADCRRLKLFAEIDHTLVDLADFLSLIIATASFEGCPVKQCESAMSTHIEIERKFLVKKLPEHFAQLPHFEIAQGYIAFDKRGVEVRLRKAEDRRFLTVKLWRDDGRVEREIQLTNNQFGELWHGNERTSFTQGAISRST
jgi:hypothetical protein